MSFIPVREPGTNWLLFRYDPETGEVEIQRRGKRTLVNLKTLSAQALSTQDATQVQPKARTPRATGPPVTA